MLVDRCVVYWNNFLFSLADSTDGILLAEKANLTEFRKCWVDGEFSTRCLRKSKRFVNHKSILEKVVSWISSIPDQSSNPFYEIDELSLLENFAVTF